MKFQSCSNFLFLFVGTIQSMLVETKTLPAGLNGARASAFVSPSTQPPLSFVAPAPGASISVPHVTTCSQGKKLPHPDNPNKYFQCQFISKADVWLTQPLNCPSLHHVFDLGTQSCVDKRTKARIEPVEIAEIDHTAALAPAPAAVMAVAATKRKPKPSSKPSSPPADLTLRDTGTAKLPKEDRLKSTEAAGAPASESLSLGIITKLAGTIETLASTVQVLAKDNERLSKLVTVAGTATGGSSPGGGKSGNTDGGSKKKSEGTGVFDNYEALNSAVTAAAAAAANKSKSKGEGDGAEDDDDDDVTSVRDENEQEDGGDSDEFFDNDNDGDNSLTLIPSTVTPLQPQRPTAGVNRPHTVLVSKVPPPPSENIAVAAPTATSSESTEKNVSTTSAEQNKNPFENSLLKMWMMNFLPKPKIMTPFANQHSNPNSLLVPTRRRHEVLPGLNLEHSANAGAATWKTAAVSSKVTERPNVFQGEWKFIPPTIAPPSTTTAATEAPSPSTSTTLATSTSKSTNQVPEFDIHYINQPSAAWKIPAVSTVRPQVPPPLPQRVAPHHNHAGGAGGGGGGGVGGGSLINLFSLFKRLTSSPPRNDHDQSSEWDDDESVQSEEDRDHRFPFSNPPAPVPAPSPGLSPFSLLHTLINSGSNSNPSLPSSNENVKPFIFHRIPMPPPSTPSKASSSASNESNHSPLPVQDVSGAPSPARVQDKSPLPDSPNDDNSDGDGIRRPRQPKMPLRI